MKNQNAGLGLLLILIGLFFLLDKFHVIPELPHYLFTWPMILIIIGLFNILSGNFRTAFIVGGIGALFLLSDIYHFRIGELWPIILILIGLSILIRKKGDWTSKKKLSDNYLEDVNIFGGSNKQIVSQNLQGVKITNIFGGSKIDFTGSKSEHGAVIEVFVLFGGVELIVPTHWKVTTEVSPVLGGFDDKRTIKETADSPEIIIRGTILFGGGELKSS